MATPAPTRSATSPLTIRFHCRISTRSASAPPPISPLAPSRAASRQSRAAAASASAARSSKGKDTPSGHWEIAGVPVPFDWGYFPKTEPTFPPDLIAQLIEKSGIPGILGDKHASGTTIIAELGEESIRTGKPICYTSIDSVFQIAAHETHFGLDRLYKLCETAFELTAPLMIGRVIARPFVGENANEFKRTGNRRDFAIAPPEPTLLDRAQAAGRQVYAIGKISDIYAGHGVTHKMKATGNMALFDRTLEAMEMAADGAFIMVNFVDFDQEYGHRRDVPRLRPGARSLRCPHSRADQQAQARRPRRLHRRPRQRSDLARQRPHPRTGADPLLFPNAGARNHWHPADLRGYR